MKPKGGPGAHVRLGGCGTNSRSESTIHEWMYRGESQAQPSSGAEALVVCEHVLRHCMDVPYHHHERRVIGVILKAL